MLLADAYKHTAEFLRVFLAVVGGNLHANQQHSGLGLVAGGHHLYEVVFCGFEWKAAQGIVAPELNHHHFRLVLAQQSGQTRQTACSGVATDAGVDHLPLRFVFGQLFVQQSHPTRAPGNAVFRAQRVAHHQ